MARRRVKLQFLVKGSTRRATLKKRRANLMKKASELATLCDVDTCVVVYGEGESQPEVWPPSTAEATRILGRFKNMPETEKCQKKMDMEGILRQGITKLQGKIEKTRREYHASETALLLNDVIAGRRPGLVGLSHEELARLKSTVNTRLEAVRNAKQRLQRPGHGDPAAALPSLEPLVPYNVGSGDMEVDVLDPYPQGWLMDVSKAGGFGTMTGTFGGDIVGTSTSGGLGDMLQPGNTMAGLPRAAHEPSFPPPM